MEYLSPEGEFLWFITIIPINALILTNETED